MSENRIGILSVINTRTRLLALICFIIETGLCVVVPQLDSSSRLIAFLACVGILVIMIIGIFWLEKTSVSPEMFIKEEVSTKTSLEEVVVRLFQGAKARSSFRGYLINSGRFLERYSDVEKKNGVKLGRVSLLMPSAKAIELAYKGKNGEKKAYLIQTIRAYTRQWEELKSEGYIKEIKIRYIDAFPTSLYMIRDSDVLVTGLYETDSTHTVGFTCTTSWLGSREADIQSYTEWFDSIWNESSDRYE